MRLAAWAVLIVSASAWAQTYRIAGVVVKPDGRPAKRVRVALAPSDARENQTAMITGESGAFLFENLPAGKFHLTAESTSGTVQSFGQRTFATGFSTSLATGPEQNENLRFQLIPLAAIRGRVTDTDGDAVEGALVQIFMSTLMRGKRTIYYTDYRYTDDRGEYRFGSLRDGTYYVVVTGTPWYVDRGGLSPDSSLGHKGYVTTYYPNATDPRSATPVQVKPGQEGTANLSLAAVPAVTLTVTPKLETRVSVRLDLMSEGLGGSQVFAATENGQAPGPNLIRGVQPGRYMLRLRAVDGGKTLYGAEPIVVGTEDMRVEVPLKEAPAVSGKVRMEDGSAIPEGAYVELENEMERVHARRAVAADGTFRFEGIAPGSYRPLLGTTRRMIRLRGVKLDGSLVKEEMIGIGQPAALEITASLRGGEIRGEVYRNGKPVEGVLALLAPKKESANPLDYRAFQTDSDGSFEWMALPAGEYVLMVQEDWLNLEYANPAAIRSLVSGGRPVQVDETGVQKIRVELK